MNASSKRLSVYVLIAALTHFLTSDQVVMMSNDTSMVAQSHWFTWLLLFLGGLLQVLNVVRAFIDKSLGNEGNDELKAELVKLQTRYDDLQKAKPGTEPPKPSVP